MFSGVTCESNAWKFTKLHKDVQPYEPQSQASILARDGRVPE